MLSYCVTKFHFFFFKPQTVVISSSKNMDWDNLWYHSLLVLSGALFQISHYPCSSNINWRMLHRFRSDSTFPPGLWFCVYLPKLAVYSSLSSSRVSAFSVTGKLGLYREVIIVGCGETGADRWTMFAQNASICQDVACRAHTKQAPESTLPLMHSQPYTVYFYAFSYKQALTGVTGYTLRKELPHLSY